MSIARLEDSAVTPVRCLVVKEKLEGYRWKEYADANGRMLVSTTQQLSGNVMEFEKHWS